MATQEYLLRYIEAHKRYEELPARLKLAVTEEEWCKREVEMERQQGGISCILVEGPATPLLDSTNRALFCVSSNSFRVKSYCIHRGYQWKASPAVAVIAEHDYYDALLSFYRSHKRIFPYHLGEYICRFLRTTPFRYYRDVLADAMREDLPYDAIPNFTAADAVQVVGVGRNEYIAIMVQAKSKKILWRVNKSIVKDLLPSEPKPLAAEPWWAINVVNLSEPEYRSLTDSELAVCQAAASTAGGAEYASFPPRVVAELYRRGLVWFVVPINPDDQLSIPPLEGFVSNKTSKTSAEEVDPMETLMYQVFVAASDKVTVRQLAGILNVAVDVLVVAISIACRLKFCRKLQSSSDISEIKESEEPTVEKKTLSAEKYRPMGAGLDLDGVLAGSVEIPSSITTDDTTPRHGPQDHPSTHQINGIALVVDAEVTGFLMMGALTPALKKHSVTLFEGGRVYGTAVIEELVNELHASVAMAQDFEGEMQALAATAAALATILECVRSNAGNRGIELLRKESVENLSQSAAFRILKHSYDVVLPVAGLPAPSLPLSVLRPGSPTNYGPLPAATSPWMHLLLYKAAGYGPPSLVVPAGRRINRLPLLLLHAEAALVWPWDAGSVKVKPGEPLVVPSTILLHCLNSVLSRTSLLVQPLESGQLLSVDGDDDDGIPLPLWLDVPLPFVDAAFSSKNDKVEEEYIDSQMLTSVTGYSQASNSPEKVDLPSSCIKALGELGLGGALGTLRVIKAPMESFYLPLSISLGVPLQPEFICRAVCDNAMAARFLDPTVMQKHNEGQQVLHSRMMALATQHGAWSAGAGGPDADLSFEVPLPVHELECDGRGLLRLWSGRELQGPSLVHYSN